MNKKGIQLTKIEKGTFLKGSIGADTDIRIDGVVEGELKTSQKIFIGETGTFKGQAIAKNIDLCGKLDGEIHVEKKLFLKETAILTGDIRVGSIEIEEGAYFKGKCNVIKTVGTSSISSKMKSLDPKVNDLATSESEEIIQESIA
tara:strand:- start:164 stop:598 length:435 start_codon:yes stop_codon:yes gene_type:complete